MSWWSFWKPREPQSFAEAGDLVDLGAVSPYSSAFLAALERTEKFGFGAPPRLLVRRNCVDMEAVMPMADLARVRDSRCDLRDEFGMGQDP